MNKWFLLVLAIVVGAVMIGYSSYRGLVSMNQNIATKWTTIEFALADRADLIPELVAVVKTYTLYEQNAILAVSDAGRHLSGAYGPQAKAQANADLTSALSRLLVVSEKYPSLQADNRFKALLGELQVTEKNITMARKDYNEAVSFYNIKIHTLPTSIFAGVMGVGPKEIFKAEEAADELPKTEL